MAANPCGHDWVVDITQQEDELGLDRALINAVTELEGFSRFAIYINKFFKPGLPARLLNRDSVIEELSEHEVNELIEKVSRNKIRISRNYGYVSTYVPIYFMGNVIGVLVIESEKELSERVSMLAIYMLNIYANQVSLLYKSQLDPLTELLNRQTFDKKVIEIASEASLHTKELDSKYRHWYLAIVDIDHFKRVNDNYGHVIGDEVILLVAQLLKNNFRIEDYVFRYGGEEFAVLFQASDELDARNALNRFRGCVAEYPFPQVGNLTVSSGFMPVYEFEMVASLVQKADQALYHSKNSGRNCVTAYSELDIQQSQPLDDDSIELF
ncbi:GGDEF domain-containing protein [Pseudoalteromonas shioyasakiensis]|uniref:GGDEF domain-containing protein n=2 Tax=Pseudoalteromonas TaxID=53246 RepID=UPI000C89F3FE|nr:MULTISPECIES: GGDEF domain-containing protein [Pseudoalteromonas]MAD04970.1 GGDEF domain-containing protein [Pseudoalteromonas sp.]MCG9707301.1 GGDEF domain-containing protein [Pseudoalteromonas sp. Isolate3]MCP4586030.1 GGDEF domain-containing protein [Pseudoalteromonas sp.]MCQ8880984.1 GGDEF domain-containing protein [Pseudoalteromonas shioyasakiensis]QLE10186.1 GGDEF domain-containing protein [Pseudoalteromonas shioyasakiensis]|tara:strand:+ start:38203 stop:39177 length:975 start_codon:yes stop_codon:yes gene_type:complete